MPYTITIVEDNHEISELLSLYLQAEGFQIIQYFNGKEALENLLIRPSDLIILDLMLPEVTGETICQELRKNNISVPIIMLTAKDAEIDYLMGLAIGADDYMKKPFLPLEVVARAKAQIRRHTLYNSPKEKQRIVYKDLTLDIPSATLMQNNQKIHLTPNEFKVIYLLLTNQGEVLSAEQLLEKIWNDSYYEKTSNSISVHIRHLREKLHDSADHPKYIHTIWGMGYTIEKE